jgi:hypothetical protein
MEHGKLRPQQGLGDDQYVFPYSPERARGVKRGLARIWKADCVAPAINKSFKLASPLSRVQRYCIAEVNLLPAKHLTIGIP